MAAELASRAQNREKKAQDFSSIMTSALNRQPGREGDSGARGGREVWGKAEDNGDGEPAEEVEKEKADFGLSGALAGDEETGNVLNGVVLKFTEPGDAKPPPTAGPKWRFYVFKGEEMVETMHLGKQSAYLIGRDKAVADIYLRHPSLSKQHAVLQYRVRTYVDPDRPFLVPKRAVLPYIMDLGSTNGTFLNGERIEGQRYYELREKDNLRFGESTREFVLLTDQSN